MTWKIGMLAAFLFLAPGVSKAGEPKFIDLGRYVKSVNLGGRTAEIGYNPSIALGTATDQGKAHFRIVADLASLQRELPALIDGDKKHDECGKRVTISGATLKPAGAAASITGKVYFAQWKCIKHILKTKLFEQTAQVCLEASPVILEDGKALSVSAKVTCARPSEGSLLALLDDELHLQDDVRKLASDALNKALARENTVLALPEELKSLNPVMTAATFVTLPGGALGLKIEGEFDGAAATALIFQKMLHGPAQ